MSDNLNQHLPPGLLDKLNKLKNLEEGAKSVGSMEEAANAAEKFQALLLKYNLDEETVLSEGVKAKVQMLCSEYDLDKIQSKTEAGWLKKLVLIIAKHCICKVVVKGALRHKYDQGILYILGGKTKCSFCILHHRKLN